MSVLSNLCTWRTHTFPKSRTGINLARTQGFVLDNQNIFAITFGGLCPFKRITQTRQNNFVPMWILEETMVFIHQRIRISNLGIIMMIDSCFDCYSQDRFAKLTWTNALLIHAKTTVNVWTRLMVFIAFAKLDTRVLFVKLILTIAL